MFLRNVLSEQCDNSFSSQAFPTESVCCTLFLHRHLKRPGSINLLVEHGKITSGQRPAVKASQELAKLEERFWESGVEAVELGVQDTPREQDEVLGDRSLQRWKFLKGVAVLEGYVSVSFHLFRILTAVS